MIIMCGNNKDTIREIKNRNREMLLSFPNVVGVGLGRKVIGGLETDQVVIRVYVAKKVPKECLTKEDMIPREVEGIPIDVVEIGKINVFRENINSEDVK